MYTLPIIEGYFRLWKKIPKGLIERKNWLNRPTEKEQEELVAKALRRYQFRFTTNKSLQPTLKKLKATYL